MCEREKQTETERKREREGGEREFFQILINLRIFFSLEKMSVSLTAEQISTEKEFTSKFKKKISQRIETNILSSPHRLILICFLFFVFFVLFFCFFAAYQLLMDCLMLKFDF